jgi:mannose-6-phosphate isomerase-like protein (cupin superfamily)
MARVFRRGDATALGLPGRASFEIVSGSTGARALTLRRVEIAAPQAGDPIRAPHHHAGLEECIYVLAGHGTTHAESGEFALGPGDTILIPAGERHVTRNTGTEPLVLLCFYPSAHVSAVTREPGPDQA